MTVIGDDCYVLKIHMISNEYYGLNMGKFSSEMMFVLSNYSILSTTYTPKFITMGLPPKDKVVHDAFTKKITNDSRKTPVVTCDYCSKEWAMNV